MRWNIASVVLALAVAVLGAPAEPASHAPYRRATADAAQNQTKSAFLNERSSCKLQLILIESDAADKTSIRR
jgi:hypothetical protein